MEIPSGTSTLDLPPEWTILNLRAKFPFDYSIKTKGGSIIEGTVVPNTPLKITRGSDIISVDLITNDSHREPIHLVKEDPTQ